MARYLCALLLALFLVAICLPAANATIPSFRGYTGLMIIPTADALCKGQFTAGVFLEDVSTTTVNDFVAHYGVANGLEVGFDRYRFDSDTNAQTMLDAKYAFLAETDKSAGIAAGIADLTNDVNTTVYVVASKSLNNRVRVSNGEIISPRLHVGFGGGQLQGLFAGLSAYLGDKLQLIFEWDSRNTNGGIRWRLNKSLTLHAGVFDIFDRDNSTTDVVNHIAFGTGLSFSSSY